MSIKKDLKVSVIMSIYNETEEFLKESIESILNQTYKNFEFIIINDNPQRELNTDILNKYLNLDKRIIIVKNNENIGLTKSLNIGLKLSKGDYIARMDADDISLPHRFQKQIDVLKTNDEIGLCGSAVQIIGSNFFFRRGINYYPVEQKHIKMQMLFTNPIAHPTVMFKKHVFLNNNLFYDEELRTAQDYDLWYRAIEITKFYNIKEPLLKYRVSKNQISLTLKIDQDNVSNNIRSKALRSLMKVSTDEINLHNKTCNYNNACSLEELQHLNLWFDKLVTHLKSNNSFNGKDIYNILNFYLQQVYLNHFSDLKRFRYFKTNTFKNSNRTFKSSFLFILKCILKRKKDINKL